MWACSSAGRQRSRPQCLPVVGDPDCRSPYAIEPRIHAAWATPCALPKRIVAPHGSGERVFPAPRRTRGKRWAPRRPSARVLLARTRFAPPRAVRPGRHPWESGPGCDAGGTRQGRVAVGRQQVGDAGLLRARWTNGDPGITVSVSPPSAQSHRNAITAMPIESMYVSSRRSRVMSVTPSAQMRSICSSRICAERWCSSPVRTSVCSRARTPLSRRRARPGRAAGACLSRSRCAADRLRLRQPVVLLVRGASLSRSSNDVSSVRLPSRCASN